MIGFQRRRDLLGPVAILAATAVCTAVEATTVIYVDDDAAPGGDGTSWTSACRFLQDALPGVMVPPGGVEIRIADGVYVPDRDEAAPNGTGDRTATFTLFVLDNLTIRGGYAGVGALDPDERDLKKYATVLSGDLDGNDGPDLQGIEENSLHVMTTLLNVGSPITLDGVVIEAGNANVDTTPHDNGGGILNTGAHLQLSQCIMQRNWALQGSCIYNDHGVVSASACAFNSNDGSGLGIIILAFEGMVSLESCVLTGNGHHSFASGIFAVGGDTTVTSCTFTDNRAHMGMIDLSGGTAHVSACGFFDQTGPAVDASATQLTIEQCQFDQIPLFPVLEYESGTIPSTCAVRDCSFRNTGQVFARTSYGTTIERCTFEHMEGVGGGGLWLVDGSHVIDRCAFLSCHATHGGAVQLDFGADAVVSNCLFANNTASLQGSSVTLTQGSFLRFINCTFTGSPLEAGMLAFTMIQRSSVIMSNCIVWNHGPLAAPDMDVMASYSAIEGGWPGVGNVDADPQFVDADGRDDDMATSEDNDYRLSVNSPCIDAGSNPDVPLDAVEDLGGNPRFQDDPATIDTGFGRAPIVDMGAFEFQPSFDPADLDEDGDVDGIDLALLLGAWGACPTKGSCSADLDGNDVVNGFDLAILLAAWG